MKVSDLEGPMLDYWVARAIGIDARVEYHPTNQPKPIACWLMVDGTPNFDKPFSPSADWSQGGPLIDEYNIELQKDAAGWIANKWPGDPADSGNYLWFGPTTLISAMRALVASKFGEEVSDDPAP